MDCRHVSYGACWVALPPCTPSARNCDWQIWPCDCGIFLFTFTIHSCGLRRRALYETLIFFATSVMELVIHLSTSHLSRHHQRSRLNVTLVHCAYMVIIDRNVDDLPATRSGIVGKL